MLAQSPVNSGSDESGDVLVSGSSSEGDRSEISAASSGSTGTACSNPILISDTDSDAEEEVVRKRKVPHRSTSASAQEGLCVSTPAGNIIYTAHSSKTYTRSASGACSTHTRDTINEKRARKSKYLKRTTAERECVPMDLRITMKQKHLRSLQAYADMLTSTPKLPQRITTIINGTSIRFVFRNHDRVVLTAHPNGVLCAGYVSFTGKPEVPVAIKMFNKEEEFNRIIQEASLLTQAGRHRAPVGRCFGLIPFLTSKECKFHIAGLVMELIGNDCTLELTTFRQLLKRSILKDNDNLAISKTLTKAEWMQILGDLAYAVSAVNNNGVILNGLMQDTILVKKDKTGRWRPYIVDFYLARAVDGYVGMENHYDIEDWKADYPYMAPEMFQCKVLCSWHQDIYSLGVILQCVGRDLDIEQMLDLATLCYRLIPEERLRIIHVIKYLGISRFMSCER